MNLWEVCQYVSVYVYVISFLSWKILAIYSICLGCFFVGAFAKLWKAAISFIMSVHPHGMTWLPLDGFAWILYLSIFWKSVKKFQVSLKSDKNKDILCGGQYTYFIISHSVLRMRNVSGRSCIEYQNTYFMLSNIFFKNFSVYEIMWKNI